MINTITPDEICAELASLFAEEQQRGGNEYLIEHSASISIRRHVEVFEQYCQFLPEGGRILDWGCNHGPDSCMIRAAFGEKYELHGCDFPDAGCFPIFHDFANIAYKKLATPYQLPYPENYFGAVIGSGVLEHAAMDYEALKAVYRVLTNDGIFVISFLPNRLSYVEFLARNLGLPCHRRLYGMSEIKAALKHHGFEPLYCRYHQFTPAHRLRRVFDVIPWIDALGERAWPLNQFCSTIMIVARKVLVM